MCSVIVIKIFYNISSSFSKVLKFHNFLFLLIRVFPCKRWDVDNRATLFALWLSFECIQRKTDILTGCILQVAKWQFAINSSLYFFIKKLWRNYTVFFFAMFLQLLCWFADFWFWWFSRFIDSVLLYRHSVGIVLLLINCSFSIYCTRYFT